MTEHVLFQENHFFIKVVQIVSVAFINIKYNFFILAAVIKVCTVDYKYRNKIV